MNKKLNEILENNPELEKDKEKLEKAIEDLENNNPKIVADKKFKKSLKSRIEGLIGLRQNKKSNFVIFAIPVFSFIFVIGGFFYYFKDVLFIGKGQNIDIPNIEKISEDDLIKNKEIKRNIKGNNEEIDKTTIMEVEEIGEIFDDEIKNIEESEKLNEIDESKINKIISIDKVENQAEGINNDENQTELINNDIQTEGIATDGPESNPININSETNNNLDIIEEMFIESLNEEEMEMDDSIKSSNAIIYKALLDKKNKNDFETYCNEQSGVLSGTGELEKCMVEEAECLKINFKNGVCDFVKKD